MILGNYCNASGVPLYRLSAVPLGRFPLYRCLGILAAMCLSDVPALARTLSFFWPCFIILRTFLAAWLLGFSCLET